MKNQYLSDTVLIMFLTTGLLLFGDIAAQNKRGISVISETPDTMGVRRAILVGISKYKNEGRSATTAGEDAKLMNKFLMDNKFKPEDIALLLGKEATAVNFFAELQRLVKGVKAHDEVILYFSLDYDHSQDISTGYFLMYGVERNGNYEGSDVMDVDNVKGYVKTMAQKGVKVTLIVEAPHSGEIANSLTEMPNVVLMFACQGKETNKELRGNSNGYGAFTFKLIEGLKGKADEDVDGKVTVSEMTYYLRRELKDYNQNPVVVGIPTQLLLKAKQAQGVPDDGNLIVKPATR